ncbi:hypothetical protein HK098_005488 [Nowakowskiella sp. JEL0407]|nr:hypothetical protein HK098_005488 [Nowakowskiella sp. JEL0407]
MINAADNAGPKHFRSKITPIAWKSLESYCKDRNLRLHKPVIRKNRNQTTVEIMVNRETFSIPTESYKTEKLGIELTSLFILELLKDDEKSSAEDVCFVFSAMCEKNIYTAATKQADSSLFGKGVTLSLKEKFTGVGYPSYAMARKEAITAALIELDKKGNFRKSFCQSIERPFRPLVYPLTVQSVLPSSKDTPTFKFLEAFSDRMQFIISYSYAVDERDKFCSAIRLQYSHHVVPDVTVYGQNTFDSKELARESVEAVVYRGVNGLLVKNILSELSRLSNSDALWLKCVPLNEATKKRSLSELGGLSEGNDKRLKSVEESEQVDISDESGAEESNQSIGELDENGRFDDDLEMLGSDMTSNSVETSSLHNFSDDAPELGAQSDATTSLNNSPAYVPEKSEIDSPSSIRGNSPEPKIELEPWSTPKRNELDEQGSDEMLDNISVKSEPKSLDDDHIMIISHTIPRPHFEVAKSSSLHATPSPNNNQISTTSSLTLLPTNYIPNMNHFPLHYACAICDFDSILQLANNETIRQPDLHGRFPLHYFCAACDLNSAIIEQVVWKLAGLSDTNEITTLEILSKQDNNYLTPLAISLAVDARVALEMKRKRNKLDRVLTDFRQNLPKVYASTITQILSEMQPSLNSYHPGSRRTCFHGLVLQVGKRLKEKSFDDVGLLASELVFVILNWFRNGLDLFLEDVRKESGWSLLNRLSAETSETKFRQVWEKLKDIEKWVEEQRMLTQ